MRFVSNVEPKELPLPPENPIDDGIVVPETGDSTPKEN